MRRVNFYHTILLILTLLAPAALQAPLVEGVMMQEVLPGAKIAGFSWLSGLLLVGGLVRAKAKNSPLVKEWIKGPLISLVTFFVFWLILEGVCGLVLRWRSGPDAPIAKGNTIKTANVAIQHTGLRLIAYNQLGIARPSPGIYQSEYAPLRPPGSAPPSAPNAGTVSITYRIDSLSRRVTPFNSQSAVGRYALFLGCSFTYGESVGDSATLPYFFGRKSGYKPYNYGVSGYSPAHILALMQTHNLRNEVGEKDGVAFYTFIEDHLARSTPSTQWVRNTDGFLPHVDPERVVVDGTFAQKHPTLLNLIRLMYKSNIINLFKVNFPRQYSAEQQQRFVSMVKKMKDIYRSQFGNDHFYVVIFPGYPLRPELRQRFERAGLKLVDYANLLRWETAEDRMHPDAKAYRQVAQKLAKDLHLSAK